MRCLQFPTEQISEGPVGDRRRQGAIDPSLVWIVGVARLDRAGDGRVYTLHIAVGDGSGNVGVATAEVHVPVGRNGAVVGGPVAYEVTGTCDVEYAPLDPVSTLAARGENDVETIDDESATRGEAELPAEFALLPAYPNPFASPATLRFGLPDPSPRMDLRAAEVERGGRAVELSAKEFQLLRYFLERRGVALSRDEILNEVWGYDAIPTTRTVDVPVVGLRQKLEANPRHPRHILTVHGIGYKFSP